MSHTPEQARELWCPMVRIARRESTEHYCSSPSVVVAGCNTDALCGLRVPASCRCIADKCAMWRWVERREPSMPDPHSDTIPPRFLRGKLLPSTHGYCGLAGRPEVTP